MQEIVNVTMVVAVMLLSTLGGIFLVGDFREFRDIVQKCETQGYIQNNKTTVICAKEN